MFLPYNLVELCLISTCEIKQLCLISTCEIKHKSLPGGLIHGWEAGEGGDEHTLFLLPGAQAAQGHASQRTRAPSQHLSQKHLFLHMNPNSALDASWKRKGQAWRLREKCRHLGAHCSPACTGEPSSPSNQSYTHPDTTRFSPLGNYKNLCWRKINTQSLLSLYQMWFLFNWQALFYSWTCGTSHGKNRSFFFNL